MIVHMLSGQSSGHFNSLGLCNIVNKPHPIQVSRYPCEKTSNCGEAVAVRFLEGRCSLNGKNKIVKDAGLER